MYCPQCGTESSTGQQYCRVCGANLKVIGKAVTLSEAIARSDRGPLPKIKEMMKNIRIEQVSEEIEHALEQMNKEIARSRPPKEEKDEPSSRPSQKLPWWAEMKMRETPEQRREQHLTKGTISFFSGIGLMVFLYFFSAALVLKLPPDFIAKIPFDLEPAVHMIWLIGLIPALTGLGRITAGLLIKPAPAPKTIEPPEGTPQQEQQSLPSPDTTTQPIPPSITEHTTELLDQHVPLRRTNEIKER